MWQPSRAIKALSFRLLTTLSCFIVSSGLLSRNSGCEGEFLGIAYINDGFHYITPFSVKFPPESHYFRASSLAPWHDHILCNNGSQICQEYLYNIDINISYQVSQLSPTSCIFFFICMEASRTIERNRYRRGSIRPEATEKGRPEPSRSRRRRSREWWRVQRGEEYVSLSTNTN